MIITYSDRVQILIDGKNGVNPHLVQSPDGRKRPVHGLGHGLGHGHRLGHGHGHGLVITVYKSGRCRVGCIRKNKKERNSYTGLLTKSEVHICG